MLMVAAFSRGLGKVIQLWGGDEEGEGEGSSDGSEEVENQSGAE